jgi:hypothetical protein
MSFYATACPQRPNITKFYLVGVFPGTWVTRLVALAQWHAIAKFLNVHDLFSFAINAFTITVLPSFIGHVSFSRLFPVLYSCLGLPLCPSLCKPSEIFHEPSRSLLSATRYNTFDQRSRHLFCDKLCAHHFVISANLPTGSPIVVPLFQPQHQQRARPRLALGRGMNRGNRRFGKLDRCMNVLSISRGV